MEDSCLSLQSPWSLLRKLQQTEQTQHGLSASQPGWRLSLTVDHGEAFAPLLQEPCGRAPRGCCWDFCFSEVFFYSFLLSTVLWQQNFITLVICSGDGIQAYILTT